MFPCYNEKYWALGMGSIGHLEVILFDLLQTNSAEVRLRLGWMIAMLNCSYLSDYQVS